MSREPSSNRLAIITGASSGIGLALSNELARRGWAVGLLARREDLIGDQVARLRAAGHKAAAVACDVTSAESVRQAVGKVETELGPTGLAIANAGLGLQSPARKFDLAEAEAMMRTNFFGMLYLFDAVIGGMLARGTGHFVGIASLAGLRGLPASGIYSASKAAMQAFLEAVRVELAGNDIRVTTVNPGFVRTAMTEKNRFRMPFLMEVERAAELIVNGLERGAAVIEFPLGTSLMMRVARALPNAIYDRVMRPFAGRKVDPSRR